MTDDLDQLETWLGGILANLSPAERRKFAREQGIALRRSNRDRIKGQLNPDGSPFEPRKRQSRRPIRSKRGRIKRQAAAANNRPMFKRLRQLLALETTADEISIGFRQATTARVARVHQLGLVDQVTKKPGAPSARYPQRILLGFTEEDRRRLMDAALELVTPKP